MSRVRTERVPGPDGDQVAVRVLLDAPRQRNALDLEAVTALRAVMDDRPDLTLLLGSTTADIFCAGADLTVDDATRTRLSDGLYACYESMVTRPGAVIAVVEGAAVGGGAQLTTAADIRIGTPRARWRWAGPGHGLAVGAWVLPDLIGRGRALELMLTGRWLDADEAHVTGLLAHRAETAWPIAERLAATIAELDPPAVARLKAITAHTGLLERLREERVANREAWDGRAPRAADDGRRAAGRTAEKGA